MSFATTPLRSFLMLVALLASALQSYPQGTIQWTVNFDGWPPIEPWMSVNMTYYGEDYMSFAPIDPNGTFGRSGGAEALEGFPRNGSPYLYASFGESLAVTSGRGPFGLVSVDLAEYSALYPTPLNVPFIGYRADGSTVSTEFVTDGIIDGAGPLADFQTFYFDSQFVNLVRVEVPTYGWSLDNMVFSDAGPEPSTYALQLAGGALVWTLRRRRCGPK
jgi:hypothetical protein